MSKSLIERFIALFSGEYVCGKCGDNMIFEDEINRDSLICPNCGYSVSLDEYLRSGDDEFDDIYTEDDEPDCCKACGGPYPDCMISCKIFDD